MGWGQCQLPCSQPLPRPSSRTQLLAPSGLGSLSVFSALPLLRLGTGGLMSHPVGCMWLGFVPPTLASFTVLQRGGTLVGVKVASGVLSASRTETRRDVRG